MGDHDVDVGRAHGVAVHDLEKIPRGAVAGKAVGGGVEAVEPVLTLLVGTELATEVVGGLVLRILEVVLAVGRRLPDVENGAGDGLAGGDVTDHTVHLGDAAVGGNAILDDAATELTERSVGRPKGAENGRGGRVDLAISDNLVGNLVDEAEEGVLVNLAVNISHMSDLRLETQDIGDTVSLVAGLLAVTIDLTDSVDEVNGGHPLIDGELDLTGEVVEVADQSAHNLAVAGGGIGADAVDDGVGEVRVEAVLGCHFEK